MLLAVVLGGYAWLRQAESKPSRCPACARESLYADRAGLHWQCVPCGARFFYFAGQLIPDSSRALPPPAREVD